MSHIKAAFADPVVVPLTSPLALEDHTKTAFVYPVVDNLFVRAVGGGACGTHKTRAASGARVLNPRYRVLDLSVAVPPWPPYVYSIGRYNEVRPYTYGAVQYQDRCVHMGLDIGGPVGASVRMPLAGQVVLLDVDEGFGPMVATQHHIGSSAVCCVAEKHNCLYAHLEVDREFYILWGHLSLRSCCELRVGQVLQAGEALACMGGGHENGGGSFQCDAVQDDGPKRSWPQRGWPLRGWPPHVHVQVLLERPRCVSEVQGVVSVGQREEALRQYPDPRCVLGPVY